MNPSNIKLSQIAKLLGRRGGKANTPAQNAARARNAKLGGRPKKLKCTKKGKR